MGRMCQWTFPEDAIAAPAVVRQYSSAAHVIAGIATARRSVPTRPETSRYVPPAAAIKPAGAVVIRMLNGNAVTEPGKRK
jgi:hypothetical protein